MQAMIEWRGILLASAKNMKLQKEFFAEME